MKKKTMKVLFLIIIVIAGISGVTAIVMKGHNKLVGSSWRLESWSEQSLDPKDYGITLTFDTKGMAGGNSAVNTYSAEYRTGWGGTLRFGDIASTEMASTDPLRNQAESIYHKLLPDVRYFERNGKVLTLMNSQKKAILVFQETTDSEAYPE